MYPNLGLQYQEWKPREYKGKPALIKIKLRRIQSISVITNSLGQTNYVRYNRVSLCSKCSFGTGLFVHHNRVFIITEFYCNSILKQRKSSKQFVDFLDAVRDARKLSCAKCLKLDLIKWGTSKSFS